MTQHKITMCRNKGLESFFTKNNLGTDALTAINTISGVENAEIIKESESLVTIKYEWTGTEQFQRTAEYLAKYGVMRIDEIFA